MGGSTCSGGNWSTSSGSINTIWPCFDWRRAFLETSWSSASLVKDPSDATEVTARLNDDEKLIPSDAVVVMEELSGVCRCINTTRQPVVAALNASVQTREWCTSVFLVISQWRRPLAEGIFHLQTNKRSKSNYRGLDVWDSSTRWYSDLWLLW